MRKMFSEKQLRELAKEIANEEIEKSLTPVYEEIVFEEEIEGEDLYIGTLTIHKNAYPYLIKVEDLEDDSNYLLFSFSMETKQIQYCI